MRPLALLAVLWLASSLACLRGPQAQPPMSPEIRLDHGFRYPIPTEQHDAVIALGEGFLFLTHGPYGIDGYRRGVLGEEIDIRAQWVTCGSPTLYEYDISRADGNGWKVLHNNYSGGGPRGLHILNVDPGTLQPALPGLQLVVPGDCFTQYPIVCFNGQMHVVACLKDCPGPNQVVLARLTPQLELLAPGVMIVAADAVRSTIGLSMAADHGLLGYVTVNGGVYVQPLDETGQPAGDRVLLRQHAPPTIGQVSICPLGEDWLVAWSTDGATPRYARVGRLGQVLSPGIVLLPDGNCTGGLSVCEGDALAIIAWRETIVQAARISATGELLDPAGIELAARAYWEWYDFPRLRYIDSEWTGSHFVVLWSNFSSLPGAFAGPGGARPMSDWIARAQWLTPGGETLFAEPLAITQGSEPRETVVGSTAAGFHCLIQDWCAERTMHRVTIDALGTVLGPPERWDEACFGGEGGLWTWKLPVTRPWDRDAGAGVALLSGASWTYYEFEEYSVQVDLFHDQAALPEAVCVSGFSLDADVHAYDAAAHEDSVLVAFEHEIDLAGAQISATLLDLAGQPLREWHVASSGEAFTPTVARLAGGYLLIWSDHRGAVPQLYRALLDPVGIQVEIEGEPLLPAADAQHAPWLAPGPGQFLCVFQTDDLGGSATGADIAAVRLDGTGTLIDAEPLVVCGQLASQSRPWAVWDGYNYLVTWNAGSPGCYGVCANRVTSAGEILDGEGFSIPSCSYYEDGRVASDETGAVAVSVGENRLRLLYEPCAAGVGGGRRSAAEPRLVLGRPCPNPTAGGVTLDLDARGNRVGIRVLDPAGRLVRALDAGPAPTSERVTWDGRDAQGLPVAAGVYSIVARAGGTAATRTVVVCR